MALDTKQKRGSAICLSLPHRQWLAEPDGTLSSTDRMSLLKYCSAVAPAAPGGAVDDFSTRLLFLPNPLIGMLQIKGG